MFERFTEKARRTIFFARYEATQFGAANIEAEHLLLGLLRGNPALANRFLKSRASIDAIRKQVEQHATVPRQVSTSMDLPLSDESRRVLFHAQEESDRLKHKFIGTEHLLLGLLREEGSFTARLLAKQGLTLAAMRESLAGTSYEIIGDIADHPAAEERFLVRLDGLGAAVTKLEEALKDLEAYASGLDDASSQGTGPELRSRAANVRAAFDDVRGRLGRMGSARGDATP